MKIEIEINNLSKSPIKNSFLENIIKKTLQKNNFVFLDGKNISLSVALVTDQAIRELNRRYRKKDLITDVLSFAEFNSQKKLREVSENNIFLGEVILCYNDIVEYSKKRKMDVKKELAKVMSHGVLHLLGLRHGKRMFEMQEKVANNIK